MPQRLDDVTGDPIRLSASQRERQREAMIEQINAQTRQINALTTRATELGDGLSRLSDAHALLKVHHDGHVEWHRAHSVTFRQRLRWLFTGR